MVVGSGPCSFKSQKILYYKITDGIVIICDVGWLQWITFLMGDVIFTIIVVLRFAAYKVTLELMREKKEEVQKVAPQLLLDKAPIMP